ncbi:MAG: hypothetical protein C0172_00900 [Caldisphaera sp.]|jgi:hypothetical protein|uniref:hypothetical protein n=1 Tax=Caldisphaera sp. TaxID=2060322 RepID=UPI000CB22834|nr:MAG: hypothetical protein C0202_00335 [Caldisphaera sp.]PMP89163.1 MAG: hypothetical protein C0172_00900 [Caldisphaera sp.]
MVNGVALSFNKEDNNVIVNLANGKSIKYTNAQIEIKRKRINLLKPIISIILFSFLSISIIYYLPPWKYYGLNAGLQFALSLSLFAILIASLYSIYISADSLRKFNVLVIKLEGGKVIEYVLIAKDKDLKNKG